MKKTPRIADYPVADIILHRWSPRAMSGEKVTDEELMPLFEAARWAQSSYNGQPWRFVYAHRDTPEFKTMFDHLVEFNQSWCTNAAVLIVVCSRKTFEWNEKPSITHSFDTGAACQLLALQGTANGLVVHGMEGFNYDGIQKALNIPDTYSVEAMFAIGKPGKKENLSQDLQEREKPSGRKPVYEFVMLGTFKEHL